jgi:hypothetical protein
MNLNRQCARQLRFIMVFGPGGSAMAIGTTATISGDGNKTAMGTIPMMPGDQTMVAMGITGVNGWP